MTPGWQYRGAMLRVLPGILRWVEERKEFLARQAAGGLFPVADDYRFVCKPGEEDLDLPMMRWFMARAGKSSAEIAAAERRIKVTIGPED